MGQNQTMYDAQTGDAECQDIIATMKQTELGDYRIIDNLLYKVQKINGRMRTRLYIPKSKRQTIMHSIHDLMGHLGRRRTYYTVAEKYYWMGMYCDIYDYVSACDQCNRKKNTSRLATDQPTVVTSPIVSL